MKFLPLDSYVRVKMVVLLVLYLVQAVLQVAQPEVLNRSTTAIEQKNLEGLFGTMGLAGAVLLGNLLVDAVLKLKNQKFLNEVLLQVQSDLLDRVMRFQRVRFQEADASSYLTSIVNFASSAVESSVKCMLEVFSSCVALVICVLYMGYLSIPLTVIVVTFNLCLRLLLTKVEKQIKKNVAACNQVVRRNNGFLVEMLENMLSVRVYHKEEYFKEKLLKNETDTYRSRVSSYMWNQGQSEFVWCMLKVAEYVLVYGIGGILLCQGKITFGLFLAYPITMDYFVKAINHFLYAWMVQRNTALTNISFLDWLYEKREMEAEDTAVEEKDEASLGSGSIRFEHVSFSYRREDGSTKEILRDVSFFIEPGEKVLLQGQNGEGKSTLLYLISGQYRPESGEIFYGDIPVNGLSLEALRNYYGQIIQEDNLLTCSVDKNIALHMEPQKTLCGSLLEQLHISYTRDLKVALLSKGEKQRVNVARAFYKKQNSEKKRDRFILMGDEILANIDPQNAKNVLRLIEEEFAEDTVILVAHGETGFCWNKKITVEGGNIVVERRGAVCEMG